MSYVSISLSHHLDLVYNIFKSIIRHRLIILDSTGNHFKTICSSSSHWIHLELAWQLSFDLCNFLNCRGWGVIIICFKVVLLIHLHPLHLWGRSRLMWSVRLLPFLRSLSSLGTLVLWSLLWSFLWNILYRNYLRYCSFSWGRRLLTLFILLNSWTLTSL